VHADVPAARHDRTNGIISHSLPASKGIFATAGRGLRRLSEIGGARRKSSFQDRGFFNPRIMANVLFVRTMLPTVMFLDLMQRVSP